MQKISTLLMFDGQAEEAINFYTSLFEKSKILDITGFSRSCRTADRSSCRWIVTPSVKNSPGFPKNLACLGN